MNLVKQTSKLLTDRPTDHVLVKCSTCQVQKLGCVGFRSILVGPGSSVSQASFLSVSVPILSGSPVHQLGWVGVGESVGPEWGALSSRPNLPVSEPDVLQ